jgi:outer membrane protein assembly factor BamD (BamD/ComL family)
MRTILFFSLALALMACGGDKDAASKTDPKALEMRTRIKHMEDSVFENMAFDARAAQALLDVYKAYATTFQLDSMAPEYLFRAASVSKSMHDPQQSIFLLDRIMVDYPSWERLPEVYFLKAFIIDQDLGLKGEAQTAYQLVVDRFKDHRLAGQAQAMIENLYMTDEEWLERAKQMEEQGGTAAQ